MIVQSAYYCAEAAFCVRITQPPLEKKKKQFFCFWNSTCHVLCVVRVGLVRRDLLAANLQDPVFPVLGVIWNRFGNNFLKQIWKSLLIFSNRFVFHDNFYMSSSQGHLQQIWKSFFATELLIIIAPRSHHIDICSRFVNHFLYLVTDLLIFLYYLGV